MNEKILTKEQAVLLLATRLECSTEALSFLFRSHGSERSHHAALIIPKQHLSN